MSFGETLVYNSLIKIRDNYISDLIIKYDVGITDEIEGRKTNKVKIDFICYIDSKQFWIEYNGEQHYESTYFEHLRDENKWEEEYKNQIKRDKNVAKYCIDKTFEILSEETITQIIEPSAGNGAFSNQITGCIAFDILPENENIIKQDFLELNMGYKKGRLFIGNPPFGTNNFLLQNFYKKCVQMGDYIAFIMPIGYLNNNSDLHSFDLIYSEDLGELIYSDRLLHCCFNIYKRPLKGIKLKPDYTLKSVTIIEHRRKKGNYHTGKNKDIPDNYDFAICGWGDGCLGKTPKYIEQYALEFYIYVNDKRFYDKIKTLLEIENIRNYAKSISGKHISKMKLFKYFRENIPEINEEDILKNHQKFKVKKLF